MLLAGAALCEVVEAEIAFHFVSRGKGREASARGNVLSLGASEGNDDCGNAFGRATVGRCKPAGLARERKSRVVGGKLLANVG